MFSSPSERMPLQVARSVGCWLPNQILPPELCDIIIDFLHTDRASLISCSIVCKSWLPASRLHLWETLKLAPCNIDGFFILLSYSSMFLSYIQNVEIENAFTKLTHYEKFWTRWDNITPYLSSRRLDHVSSFRLSKVSWGLLHDMKWSSSILHNFSDVKALHLSNVSFDNNLQVIQFLRSFPRLEELSMAICFSFVDDELFPNDEDEDLAAMIVDEPDGGAVMIEDEILPFDGADDTPLWPSLSTLHFTQGHLFDVFGLNLSSRQEIFLWMAYFLPAPAIRDLVLYSVTTAELESCGRLLHAIGGSIETLTISFLTIFTLASQISEHIDLSCLMSLRSLHFRQVGWEACDCAKLSTAFLLLSQIHSPFIQSLSFSLGVGVLDSLDGDQWKSLAQALASPYLSGLQTIKFSIYYHTQTPSEKLYRSRLADCDSKGILRFEFLPAQSSCLFME
ncbi:hypothetical protein EDD18DRAFT_1159106 [Armillaria luteobubalina]|uniref:F-box domain-containing protein n=1 Tax=Armillaria luteobubalina TaxID=153913 RepID=A0AA39QA46_9AGAR|nr:hypothetical protein EDD18DRAFT_1159106 [Armillaria luteobubalina]